MDNVSLGINAVFTILMVILAVLDEYSFIKKQHKDFKSILMSLGVLGTFVGIFWGLQDFDVVDLELSVPQLLDGLKTAFYTSIVGMGLAILLSILQKVSNTKEEVPNTLEEYLMHQLGKLEHLQFLKDFPKLLQSLDKLHSLVELEQGSRQEYQQNSKKLLEESLKNQQEYKQFIEKSTQQLWVEFSSTKEAIKDTLNAMAEGLGRELVGVLEKVIKDFNLKINDHFGDNFKQLNIAVGKILQWQETYSNTIQIAQENLRDCEHSMRNIKNTLQSIAENNEGTMEVCNSLKDIIQTSSSETQKLKTILEGFSSLQDGAKNTLGYIENVASLLETSSREFREQGIEALQMVSNYLKQSTKDTLEYLKGNTQGIETYLQETLTMHQQKLVESNKLHSSEMDLAIKQYRDLTQEYLQCATNALQSQCENITQSIERGSEQLLEINLESKEQLLKSTDAIEEHLSSAVVSFDNLLGHTSQKLLEVLTQNGDSLENHSQKLGDTLGQITKNIDSLLNQTQEASNTIKESLHGSLVLMQERLGKSIVMHKNTLQEAHNAALDSFMQTQKEFLEQQKNFIQASNSSWLEIKDNFRMESQLVLQDIKGFVEDLLRESEEGFIGHTHKAIDRYEELQEKIINNLDNLTVGYIEMLGNIVKESLEAPRALNAEILKDYALLGDNIQQILQNVSGTLDSTQGSMEQIISAIHKNITENLHKTNEVNEKLCSSLEELDNSMSELTQGFREDYEWFLRRIQEFMNNR